MEKAEESTAESEPESNRALRHVIESGVVDLELPHGGLQLLEVGRVDRVDPAEDHWLNLLESGKGFEGRFLGVGEGVSDLDLGCGLDVADEIADIARSHRLGRRHLGGEDPNFLDLVGLIGRHETHLHSRPDLAGEDADIADHAAVGVEKGVEDQSAKDAVTGRGRGDAFYDRLKDFLDADPGLGTGGNGLLGGDGQEILELFFDRREIRVREVDLVDDRDDREFLFVGQMDIGHRLGLDTLGGVDNQDRPFAGGQTAGNLVGKVDVPRGIHEVEGILLTILGPVLHWWSSHDRYGR